MLKAIIRIISAVTVCVVTAQAATACNANINVVGNNNQVINICTTAQPNAAVPSLWNHNGSIMRLTAKGAMRQFLYEMPRRGLQSAGASQGTLLFTGIRQGQIYSGTAFIFRSGCAPVPYEVSGRVDDDNRSVTMFGAAPILDKACNVVDTRSDTLTFNFLGQ